MNETTHIAVGDDAASHFRLIDGFWHLCRCGHEPVRVTVPETIAALELIANIGQDR